MPAPLGLCHWFFQGVHLSIRPFIHSSICPSVHFSILPFAHSIVHSFWTFQTSDSNAANQWNVAHFSSSQISSRNYTNQMPHSMDLICLAFHLSIFFSHSLSNSWGKEEERNHHHPPVSAIKTAAQVSQTRPSVEFHSHPILSRTVIATKRGSIMFAPII